MSLPVQQYGFRAKRWSLESNGLRSASGSKLLTVALQRTRIPTLKRKRDNGRESPSPKLGTAQSAWVMTHLPAAMAVGNSVDGD